MPFANRSFRALGALILASSLAVACDRFESRTRAPSPATVPRAQSAAPAAVEEAVMPPAARVSALPSAEALSDAVITAKIKASLLADPAMRGADISVNADRGVVNLSGTVVSQEQSAIASAHAQRHDGVMRIESHVSVTQQ